MLSAELLLSAYDAATARPPWVGTGLTGLDELTDGLAGGMGAGQVWLVCGGPGQGKSTLLTQWAARLAQGGHPTQLVCPRETAAWVVSRLLACLGPLPVAAVQRHDLNDDPVLAAARELLVSLPLSVFAQDTATFIPEQDPYRGHPAPEVVVVDDADLISGFTATRATTYAGTGRLVLISLPRELVVGGPGDEAPLRPWTRTCDVVVEVRHRGLPDRERNHRRDQDDARAQDTGSYGVPGVSGDAGVVPGVLRVGEADLVVHRNRFGPARTVPVVFQGHYCRFVDLKE